MTVSRRKPKVRPSASGLGLRIALIIPLLVIGTMSIADTLANFVVKGDPLRAKALAPWDGSVIASSAKMELLAQPTSDEQSEAETFAIQALQYDPTAVEALDVLGSQAQLRGETEQARKLFTQSLALSRRDLRAHLWAIEEAVSLGDIAGALRHYDFALRTSKRAPDLLFPTLASAIEEPLVRSELLKILNAKPVWFEAFLDYISGSQINPLASVALLTDENARRLPVDDSHRTALVDAIAKSKKFAEAWQYYASFRSANRHNSRDAHFNAEIERPSIFDWNIVQSAGISAGILKIGDERVIEFSASPSVGSTVLAQQQVLPPGRYEFRAVMKIFRSARGRSSYWALQCQDGPEIWRASIHGNFENFREVSENFTVPSGCLSQTLTFTVRSSDDIYGISGQVASAEIISATSR